MPAITLKAHDDGQTVRRDEPFALAPDARLLAIVLEPLADEAPGGWADLSAGGLTRTFGDDGPEYGPDDLTLSPNQRSN